MTPTDKSKYREKKLIDDSSIYITIIYYKGKICQVNKKLYNPVVNNKPTGVLDYGSDLL